MLQLLGVVAFKAMAMTRDSKGLTALDYAV